MLEALKKGHLDTSEYEKDAALFNILRGYEEYILSVDGTIIRSNLETVNITGYEAWEVSGNHISLFYTADDQLAERPAKDLEATAERGQLSINDWRVKKRHSKFWAKVKISALRNDGNELSGFRMVIKDATHKAIYNHRVKRIKDGYLNLFNNTFTGIFKFRMKDYEVLLLNEKALDILGLEDYEGLNFRHFFLNAQVFDSFIHLLNRQEQVQHFEFQINKAGREERWGSIGCKYFKEQGFIEGILIDVTDSKNQVLELQRLNHELDQFIYHASHDLRSPLSTILGLVNLIGLDQPTPLISKYTELISERVHYLDGLLSDLVSITYNNKTGLQAELINFETEFKSILRDFQHQYQHIQVFLAIEGAANFHTDAVRFRTILRNLISNALKYHNPTAKDPFINIAVTNHGHKAMIVIEDNGIGIDNNHLYQIFGMFFRATTQSKGTGLGLYIVKSMIDKLGGHISVKSKQHEGTSFFIELPDLLHSEK
jgi:PAS domain S-box-containing protein